LRRIMKKANGSSFIGKVLQRTHPVITLM